MPTLIRPIRSNSPRPSSSSWTSSNNEAIRLGSFSSRKADSRQFKVCRSRPEGPHGGLLAAESRHQNHGNGGEAIPDLLNKLQAIHVGHDQIGENQLG